MSICIGYIVNGETDLLRMSILANRRIPEIRSFVVLDTGHDFNTRFITPTTSVTGINYGCGFNLSVEEGGFDEICARNQLLNLMRVQAQQHDCDWLLICDADEIYLPSLSKLFARVRESGKQSALLECWHAENLTQHRLFAKRIANVHDTLMFDPHPRLIHRDSGFQYQMSRLGMTFRNKTMHCYLHLRWFDCFRERNFCHIHLRNMFKHPDTLDHNLEAFPFPIDWPEHIRTAFESGWKAGLTGETALSLADASDIRDDAVNNRDVSAI